MLGEHNCCEIYFSVQGLKNNTHKIDQSTKCTATENSVEGAVFLWEGKTLCTKCSAALWSEGQKSNYIKYHFALCQLFSPHWSITQMPCRSSVQMDHNSCHIDNIHKNIKYNYALCRDFHNLYILDNLCCIVLRSTGWTRIISLVKVID